MGYRYANRGLITLAEHVVYIMVWFSNVYKV